MLSLIHISRIIGQHRHALRNRHAPITDVKAFKQRYQVLLDRAQANVEFPCNFLVNLAFAQQTQYFALSRGQGDRSPANRHRTTGGAVHGQVSELVKGQPV